ETETEGGAPVVNVLGGKLTGYRLLAEQVMVQLEETFPDAGPDWTATAPLPGSNPDSPGFGAFLEQVILEFPWLPAGLTRDYARRYGTRIHGLLDGCSSVEQLGEELGPDLFEREVRFLID